MKEFEIAPIEKLRPLEKVFPTHLENLKNMILESGVIEMPILADKNTGIVLDGSHRYAIFYMLGFKKVPVYWVNYDDEDIRVGSHLIHRHLVDDQKNISKSEVKERGLSGNLYSPRTTRHFFPFRKNEKVNILVEDLEKGEERSIDHLIEVVDIDFEIEHNIGYIREIEQELDEIESYKNEVLETKKYLEEQVSEMKSKSK